VVAAVLAATVLASATPASATVLSGRHQLMNRESSECLDVTGAAGWNGAEVKIWRCVGQANQKWEPKPIDKDANLFQLQVEHTGKCLSYQGDLATGAVIYPGANVVQDDCREGATNQLWKVRSGPNGWSYIETLARYPGGGHPAEAKPLCLDKAFGDVTIWDCHDGKWQQWQSLG
jgi:hypothetical protein